MTVVELSQYVGAASAVVVAAVTVLQYLDGKSSEAKADLWKKSAPPLMGLGLTALVGVGAYLVHAGKYGSGVSCAAAAAALYSAIFLAGKGEPRRVDIVMLALLFANLVYSLTSASLLKLIGAITP